MADTASSRALRPIRGRRSKSKGPLSINMPQLSVKSRTHSRTSRPSIMKITSSGPRPQQQLERSNSGSGLKELLLASLVNEMQGETKDKLKSFGETELLNFSQDTIKAQNYQKTTDFGCMDRTPSAQSCESENDGGENTAGGNAVVIPPLVQDRIIISDTRKNSFIQALTSPGPNSRNNQAQSSNTAVSIDFPESTTSVEEPITLVTSITTGSITTTDSEEFSPGHRSPAPEPAKPSEALLQPKSQPNAKPLTTSAPEPVNLPMSESFADFMANLRLDEQNLTRLTIQRNATNELLTRIGQETKNLKFLDIKGSRAVTNEGIQGLFFSSKCESAPFTMTWVYKHGKCTNRVAETLEYLDITYTSVNYMSRRLLSSMKGSYSFLRKFFIHEYNTPGHTVFYRNSADANFSVRRPGSNTELQAQIGALITPKSALSLRRFLEKYPWKGYRLCIRDTGKSRRQSRWRSQPIHILVIPSNDDRRVYGEMFLDGGDLVAVYSYFPIDVNSIWELFPRIQNINFELMGIWRNPKHNLHMLTTLNATADVATFLSFLPQCPNLRFLKFRISRGTLQDSEFLLALNASTCYHHLKELWIVPAFLHLKDSALSCRSTQQRLNTNGSRRLNLALNSRDAAASVSSLSSTSTREIPKGRQQAQTEITKDQVHKDARCMFSKTTLELLVRNCPVLKHIGNIMFWEGVSEEDYEKYKLEASQQAEKKVLERSCLYAWDLDLSTHWNV